MVKYLFKCYLSLLIQKQIFQFEGHYCNMIFYTSLCLSFIAPTFCILNNFLGGMFRGFGIHQSEDQHERRRHEKPRHPLHDQGILISNLDRPNVVNNF